VKTLAVDFPVAALCRELGVSRSGYYDWLAREPSARHRANERLLPLIVRAYQEGRQTYGSPRVTQALRRDHHRCGRHRVARLMRQAGLRACQRAAFRPRTTQSHHPLPLAPNRLKAVTGPQAPNRVWVADITYIATGQGWLYLAAVMDLCSRKIIGWTLADHLKHSLVSQALCQAIAQRRPPRGLVHHSDRGIQYASGHYRRLLQGHGIFASMSAPGNCYDNASMESFFSTLKTELLHRRIWHTHAEVKLALFDYVERFYNRQRLHSALNYQSPSQFEESCGCSSTSAPPVKPLCNN
jgi:putative transposase